MSYAGVGGHYWEKGASISRGSYYLDEGYPCEFGEPAVVSGTGTTAIPQNKKVIHSYTENAGSVPTIGVFITWRRAVDTWDAEDMALLGRHDFQREVALLKRGGCTCKNMTGAKIYDGDRVIPINGGCTLMTASGQHSLGIAKQDIEVGQYGLIDVQPDEEKAL